MENQILTDSLEIERRIEREQTTACVISGQRVWDILGCNFLENTLGREKYKLCMIFLNKAKKLNLILEWQYCRESMSLSCNLLNNKKENMCTLHILKNKNVLRLIFYFVEKTIEGIYELDIYNETKNAIKRMIIGGYPVIVDIENKKLLKDGLKILEYKIGMNLPEASLGVSIVLT